MAEDVAYKPIGKTNPSDASYDPIKDIINYDDVGVSFKGFSKRKISNTQYQLNPQSRWSYTLEDNGITGGHSYSLGFPPKGKKLFISSVQISMSITALNAATYIAFRDYNAELGGSPNIVWKTGLLRSENREMIFSVPLQINGPWSLAVNPSGFEVMIEADSATINKVTMNLQGWIE